MQDKFISFVKNVDQQEPTNLFLIMSYIFLITYNGYYYFILTNSISLQEIIFECIFLFLFFICIPLTKYLSLLNKPSFMKYISLGLFTLYLLTYDLIFMNTNNYQFLESYLELFLIIFAPLFLSTFFLIIVSICVLFRYLIVMYFFEIVYPGELLFTLSTSILTSFFILFTLKFLINKIKKSYERQMKETVLSIMGTLELKDPYTKGHSERVATYATILAKATNQYNEKSLNKFNLACLLHDIGKIGISDEILNKSSSLTNEEFTIIQTHPLLGIEVLKNSSFIKGYEAVIHSHHEKWNGTGYPDGLKGTEIPFNARIVAIADAFDAMTSSRPYRPALSTKEAYKRITEGAGTQFDPELVATFQKIFPLWVNFFEECKNQ